MTSTYRDVKSDILAKIIAGEWPLGSLVPNEIDLAQTYDCARATVNRAMRELAEEGLIERRRKAGTRVRLAPIRQATFEIPILRQEIEQRGARHRYTLVLQEALIAPDWLRARMQLGDGARVLHLICMHYADGAPYQHEERWINLEVLPQAAEADFTTTGPNEWLVKTVPFSDAEISFTAVSARKDIAHHLGAKPGDALFLVERATWWQGKAITLVKLHHPPGHRVTTKY